jgi:hypothetical protein
MTRPITIAAIYIPPRHTISCQEYGGFLLQLGPQFLVAGNWNAKHSACGSRLTTPKGRNLLNITQQNLNYMSAGEPTYWPTDLNKIPDSLDTRPPIQLYNTDTNWTQFQDHVNDNINLKLHLKVNQDLEDSVLYHSTNTNSYMGIYAKQGKYITGRSQPSTVHQGINLRKTQSKTQMAKKQKSTRKNRTKQANSIYDQL